MERYLADSLLWIFVLGYFSWISEIGFLCLGRSTIDRCFLWDSFGGILDPGGTTWVHCLTFAMTCPLSQQVEVGCLSWYLLTHCWPSRRKAVHTSCLGRSKKWRAENRAGSVQCFSSRLWPHKMFSIPIDLGAVCLVWLSFRSFFIPVVLILSLYCISPLKVTSHVQA